MGGLLGGRGGGGGGGGGAQRVCWPPPLKLLGGGPGPPLPTPMLQERQLQNRYKVLFHSIPLHYKMFQKATYTFVFSQQSQDSGELFSVKLFVNIAG